MVSCVLQGQVVIKRAYFGDGKAVFLVTLRQLNVKFGDHDSTDSQPSGM